MDYPSSPLNLVFEISFCLYLFSSPFLTSIKVNCIKTPFHKTPASQLSYLGIHQLITLARAFCRFRCHSPKTTTLFIHPLTEGTIWRGKTSLGEAKKLEICFHTERLREEMTNKISKCHPSYSLKPLPAGWLGKCQIGVSMSFPLGNGTFAIFAQSRFSC